MKKRLSLTRKRNLNNSSRRKQLIKKLQRKVNMRRQDFQIQLAMTDILSAG